MKKKEQIIDIDEYDIELKIMRDIEQTNNER